MKKKIGRPKNKEKEMLSITQSIIWLECRKKIIEYYGDIGVDIDKAWFSKLFATDADKVVSLIAPTSSFKNIIQNNYIYIIKKFLREKGYKVNLMVKNHV